jgi:alpha 1,3-glucosidase
MTKNTFEIILSAIEDRYRMLPMWYTAVRKANLTGEPVVQPLWFEFGSIPQFHVLESEVLVGNSLLVVPVVSSSPAVVSVVKPPGKWYNFFNQSELSESMNYSVRSTKEIVVFIRGGKIVPAYSKSARSTKEILATPITLHIALDEENSAQGELYLDDGETHGFLEGKYLQNSFEFGGGVLKVKANGEGIPEQLLGMRIDRLVFYGGMVTEINVNLSLAKDSRFEIQEVGDL